MEIDTSKINNVQLDGINTKDHPDYADAFICACDYDGQPATQEQLDAINELSDFVNEEVINYLF